MDFFPWWSEEHKQLSRDVKAFMEKIAGREMETRWTREFPFDLYEEFGKTGFTGAAIPKEYGGMGLGCTGGCIVAEEVHSVSPGMGRIIVGNMMGGLMQLLDFGTEEQKKKYLPRIAMGETGCVAITEMTAGTDASGMEVEAKLEGDHYVLNGKKRFIVGAGVADHYIVYAKSSNNPEDIKRHKHLTAFWVEKGAPGFTTERINEILGFENVQNGSLDFENVIVPVENRIGAEGEGWKVLMHGLNFERTLISASAAAWQRILMQYTVPYSKRRVQFGRPTIDLAVNQNRITDIIMRLKTTRMSVYYTAYLWDIGRDITIESSMVKTMGAEATFASAADATQVMGGDGVNRFYPIQNIFEVAKTDFIAGGTLEACRLTVFRAGLRLMSEDMKMPRRVISEKLGVPIPTADPVEQKVALSEESLLKVLGEDYRINQGLHMTIEDIQQYIDADAADIAKVIDALQEQNLVMTYRNRKGEVQLVKANYRGLNKAYPKEYYRWAPDYVTEDRKF
ncbi:MAG: acyl-CoA/acyl-ACP dehydrogenase [Peptococcaceae bacterium]|jgi:alkylation response protein AidB-like acyl-CoA dehydrogenase|nr:acyl-CoA/acyl-ACP dehydrogenase [Peptococcaceae bacterium]